MLPPLYQYPMIATLLILICGCYAHAISPPKASCSSAIRWNPCPDASQFQCTSFQVPLDYAHPEVGNATLAVARVNATKQPRLGTIFANPGGPGGSGVTFITGNGGRILSAITNGQYDLVGWDPRGVGQTTPRVSCGFTSLESLEQFVGNTIPLVGIEARGNFTDQDDIDNFFSMVNETDSILLQIGQRCLETDGAILKYMGTAAVVRDMVSLSDCIEGPQKPINYYGISYGTVIGNYFVNMFPERVGHVVIDGVVDTIAWSTEPSYKDFDTILGAADSVFAGFAEKCAAAGPSNCNLARNNSTPTSVAQGVRNLIDTAYELHKAGKSNITSFDIRDTIRSLLYTPTTWDSTLVPQLDVWATMLAGGMPTDNNLSRRADVSSPFPAHLLNPRQNTGASNSTIDPEVEEVISAVVITCGDSIDQENVQTRQVFEEIVRVTHSLSPMFGEVLASTDRFFCHRFPARAVERFTGPFDHKLANPIIVIGNKADPTTPLANAQRVATTLGKSARLLVQNGFGHSSFAENSDCTQGVVRNYFLRGELPQNGQVCETDQALFPTNITLISPSSGAVSPVQQN